MNTTEKKPKVSINRKEVGLFLSGALLTNLPFRLIDLLPSFVSIIMFLVGTGLLLACYHTFEVRRGR